MRLSERRVREMFARHGYRIERFEIGRHRKVWASRGGETHRFILAVTPSPSDQTNQRGAETTREDTECSNLILRR
jgi:hypothetical protein